MQRICYCNITYQCNNACKFCVSYNVARHCPRIVTVDDYVFFQNKFNIGENDIWTISGGEPTLSPFFEEIVNTCYRYSKHIIVYSNGRRLISLPKDIIDKIERIIVPIYGDEIAHNRYVNNTNAFEETMTSLKMIIKTNPNKIDLKILFDEQIPTENLLKTRNWNILGNNEHFSITRVLTGYNKIPSIDLVKRAEVLISYLMGKNKYVRFYDLPFCMFSDSFQKLLKNKMFHLNKSDKVVICGSAGKKYKLYSFNNEADYNEGCLSCQFSAYCTMIMKNYFCPEIYGDNITIKTE